MASGKKICIVGAGFGGLAAAHALSLFSYDITLIDAAQKFEFLPNIHEIISGSKRAEQLAIDREKIARRLGCRFICEKVVNIDSNSLLLASGKEIPFEACIVSIGCASNASDVPGATENALPVKTIADAVKIYERIQLAKNNPQPRNDNAQENESFSISIIGGGIEGLEVLGELIKAYRHVPHFEFNFISGADTLLSEYSLDLDASVRKHMQKESVHMFAGQRATQIGTDHIVLGDNTKIRSDLTIWCAGVKANPLVNASNLPNTKGWATPGKYLQSDHSNMFVIGDCTGIDHPNIEKTAGHAIDMGMISAWNVHQFLYRRTWLMMPYQPRQRPLVMSYGDLDTYLFSDYISVSSRFLAMAKEGIFNAGLTLLSFPAERRQIVTTARMLKDSFSSVYSGILQPATLADNVCKSRLYF